MDNKVLALLVTLVVAVAKDLPEDCTLIGTTLTCLRTFPLKLPTGTTEVYISDNREPNISVNTFSDDSWNNVTKLDVVTLVTSVWHFRVLSNNFESLSSLQRLGIHGDTNFLIDRHAFAGLTALRSLDMSYCTKLNQHVVFEAMLDDVNALQNLISLNMSYLHSICGFDVDSSLYTILNKFPVQILYMSGTNLVFSEDFPSNVTSSVIQLDLSNTTIAKTAPYGQVKSIFNFLKATRFLDVSDMLLPDSNISLVDRFNFENEDCWFVALTSLVANKIFPMGIEFDDMLVDLSMCQLNLRELYLRQNSFRKLNITCIMPSENNLRYLDLGNNRLAYISPNVFGCAPILEVVILTDNELSTMQYFPEFEHLLSKLSNLNHFDISNNNLSHIPNNMFENNTLLKVLNLSGNRLQTVEFGLTNFICLESLQLQNNRIIFLEDIAISSINHMIVKLGERNISTEIAIYGNPFVCSCKSLHFLEWLVYELKLHVQGTNNCSLHNSVIDINEVALKQSAKLCKTYGIPPAVWIMIIIYILSVLVFISTLSRYLYTYYLSKRLISLNNGFIQSIKQDQTRQSCLIFLSEYFDSDNQEDEKLFCNVLNNILRELRKLFGEAWNDNMLKTDNLNVGTGSYRDEAVNNILAECCVVVLLQSVSCPEHKHFKTDLELAKANKKPVCILSPKTEDQKKRAKKYYSVYPTIDLHKHECVWEPVNGWEYICKTILTMAAVYANDKDNQ